MSKLMMSNFPLVVALIMALLAACAGAAEPTQTVLELEGTQWILDELNGSAPLPGTEITLAFEQGNAAGSAGCNDYGGSYETTDGSLRIPELIRTEKLCLEPEGIMDQEDAYLAALQGAAFYQLVDDRLQIENGAGEATLIFRMAE